MNRYLIPCTVTAALAGVAVGLTAHGVLDDPAPAAGRAPSPRPAAAHKPAPPTRHLALNMPAADHAKAAALGFDLFDVGPDESAINALPAGAQALVWAGNSTCGDFQLSGDTFATAVRRLARNPRVYGWYLSDEPDPRRCPGIAGKIRERADLIHRHAPGQKAFGILTDWPMKALRPSETHLDVIGLDPYPCRARKPGCDLNTINAMVGQATEAGFDKSKIVPVFQTFGQSCTGAAENWRLPTAGQLKAILNRWDDVLPRPAFDVSYSWGNQPQWSCPTLADADGTRGRPDLQAVMKAHNTRPAPRPKPSPPACETTRPSRGATVE
ncbi:hypothetical protein [Spirillospora sp. CA-294931]|uniref:hypothetical protein n=1 Tax=Spirillospora sp. CA-294931 TaxID=3240042 RepID=UPI003D8BE0FD